MHCTGNGLRSCSTALAYVMRAQNVDLEAALALVRSGGREMKLNPSLCEQLRLFWRLGFNAPTKSIIGITGKMERLRRDFSLSASAQLSIFRHETCLAAWRLWKSWHVHERARRRLVEQEEKLRDAKHVLGVARGSSTDATCLTEELSRTRSELESLRTKRDLEHRESERLKSELQRVHSTKEAMHSTEHRSHQYLQDELSQLRAGRESSLLLQKQQQSELSCSRSELHAKSLDVDKLQGALLEAQSELQLKQREMESLRNEVMDMRVQSAASGQSAQLDLKDELARSTRDNEELRAQLTASKARDTRCEAFHEKTLLSQAMNGGSQRLLEFAQLRAERDELLSKVQAQEDLRDSLCHVRQERDELLERLKRQESMQERFNLMVAEVAAVRSEFSKPENDDCTSKHCGSPSGIGLLNDSSDSRQATGEGWALDLSVSVCDSPCPSGSPETNTGLSQDELNLLSESCPQSPEGSEVRQSGRSGVATADSCRHPNSTAHFDMSRLDAFVKSWILDTLRRTLPSVEDLSSKVAPADIVELFQQICQTGGLPPQLDMPHLTPRTCRSTQAAAVERAVYETLNAVYPASARSPEGSCAGGAGEPAESAAQFAASVSSSGGERMKSTGAFLQAVPDYPSEKRLVEFASTCHMSPQETSTPSVVSSAPKRRISVRTISGGFVKNEEAISLATGVANSS